MYESDTIAAISSGLTSSGIGIVRMSGPQAVEIADKVYRSVSGRKKLDDVPSYTANYGYIYDGEELIDEVLVLVMRAPHTYTREDVVEIDCHGGVVVMKTILDLLLRSGARPAEPGEFTKRAFLNGRIDMSQAEAVIDVIGAKNKMALSCSEKQLRGSIRDKINSLRHDILGVVASIEALLDDPEHFDNGNLTETITPQVDGFIEELEKLLASSENGRLITEGIRTVIVGRPNVGKSSVMNRLLGENRAIVTDIPGTTRDTLEETMSLNGILLNIIDTAGIRDTDDTIEKIGVDRARRYAEDAELVLFVADSSRQLEKDDLEILDLVKDKKVIVLLNKSDLEEKTGAQMIRQVTDAPIVSISAKYGSGMDELAKIVKDMFFSGDVLYNDEIVITNARQKAAIRDALESMKMVRKSIDDKMPEDFLSIDLIAAYQQLGLVTGESVQDDVADRIFSDFCVGK